MPENRQIPIKVKYSAIPFLIRDLAGDVRQPIWKDRQLDLWHPAFCQ